MNVAIDRGGRFLKPSGLSVQTGPAVGSPRTREDIGSNPQGPGAEVENLALPRIGVLVGHWTFYLSVWAGLKTKSLEPRSWPAKALLTLSPGAN
jgi:hypothetical protein